MKINIQSINIGVDVSIYISKQEIKEKGLEVLTNYEEKDYRVKRSFEFDKKVNQENVKTLDTIFNEIFIDYNLYFKSVNINGEYSIINLLNDKLKYKLSPQELELIELFTKNVVIPILFNKKSEIEVDTVRNRYNLNYKDLLIGVVGNFGYGKTTLIKKILGFDDTYKFLLVDGGRTTIYNTVVKSLIVDNDGYITTIENDEIIRTDANEYKFKNQITLHSSDYIYNNIISPNLSKAFIKYCKNSFNQIEILEEFIKYDTTNLDSFFGKVDLKKEFYSKLLKEFDILFNSSYFSEYDFYSNETLKNCFDNLYNETVNITLENFQLEITDDLKINFDLNIDNFGDKLEEIYIPFTDNSIIGACLRLLVKEIYLETNLELDNFINNNGDTVKPETIFNENGLKYYSMVFTDTIGCNHESKNDKNIENSINIDPDIIDNSIFLKECDIIFLLENSTKSMQGDIKRQFFTLENLGFIDKVIMCYSHYNQFVKTEFNGNDSVREAALYKYFENALISLFPNDSKKSDELYKNFLNKQIVFLKGLVINEEKRTVKSKTNTRTRKNIIKTNPVHELNKDCYDCNDCLSQLIDTTIIIAEDISAKKFVKLPLINKSLEENYAISYHTTMINEFLNQYLKYEHSIYLFKVPHYRTTKALCSNVISNKPIHYGTSITLRPLGDALDKFVEETSKFLYNYPPFEIQDNELTYDSEYRFLIDQIKANFNEQINEYFKNLICHLNKSTWKNLCNDSGSGIQNRRSNGIYNLLNFTFNNVDVKFNILFILRQTIKDVVDNHNSKIV